MFRIGKRSAIFLKPKYRSRVLPTPFEAIKIDNKYYFVCPDCGYKKHLSISDVDLLLLNREKTYKCCKKKAYSIKITNK